MTTELTNNPLKYLKRYFRLTQSQVAEALGKSQTSYSDLETGKTRLTTDVITKLSEFYGVDKQIFTTDLPESKWHKFLNSKSYLTGQKVAGVDLLLEDETKYNNMDNEKNKTDLLFLSLDKERLEKELQTERELNEKLKKELIQKASLIDALKEQEKKTNT
jgi:transcriptional regulator with XRE-family HTH domain